MDAELTIFCHSRRRGEASVTVQAVANYAATAMLHLRRRIRITRAWRFDFVAGKTLAVGPGLAELLKGGQASSFLLRIQARDCGVHGSDSESLAQHVRFSFLPCIKMRLPADGL